MKTIIRHLIIVFVLLLGSAATLTLQAKTVYPIQLTAQLLPPYSNCLGDYMSGSMDRVSVMAVMKDVSFEAGNQPKSYKIQLRMVVRQGNRVVLESKTKLGNAMTFDLLRDGLVKRLEGAGRLLDPAYSIINAPGYSSNGYCVNEGSYDIVFQAFDARNPQMALSEPYSFHVYLNESEPVSLMSPIHNTCVGMNTGAITFMWMERTVPLIAQYKKYHFEIREVQEGAVSMENAAETGSIVHSEELNSSVTMRVVPITAGKFKVGRTYVWRIQIVGQDTKVKNNGWSEVGVFRYDRCMDKIDVVKVEGVCNDLKKPEIVKAETLKEPQGTISWVLNDDAAKVQEIDSFRVEYTLASDQVGFWTRVPVSRTSAQAGTVEDKTFEDELSAKYKGKTYYTHQLANLDKGKEYVVRISSIKCSTDKDGNVVADCHSVADSVKFTLPLMEAGQAGQCRMEVPELTCKEDVDPNHKPNKGDYIYANGANVKILDIAPSKTEGGHTYYSGTGITSLPFLEGVVGLYMRFDDIRISCDNELLEGKIVTVYDENNSFSLDLNGLLNDNYMGTGPTPQQESIQPVRSKEQVEDGTVGIVTDGEDEGAVYAKSPEGGSAPVKVGEKFSCDEVAESDIDDEYGTFTFTPLEGDNTPYDLNAGKFDKPTIRKYYEKFGTYDVPWFAVVQGKTSTIKATFKPNAEGKEVDLDRISFICKTKKDAIKLEAKKTGDYTYTLTIFGDVPDQSLCIYAVYMEKDGKAVSQDLENDDAAQDDACKTLVTLGKAKIASMKYRKKKLIMIPVGNNITINTDNIQQTLDAVYAPLGVKYTVTQEPAFVDEQVNSILSEGLDVTDHSIFKDESQNMRLLQQLYKGTHEESIDVDATYLFVLPKVAGMESVKGIMPLNRSVGYVFVGENGGEYADGVTVAHELGHGMFSFQHSFDYGPKEGETDNLMDYSNPEGTHLAVWQWNLISTHKTYTIPFLTTDEDAMFLTGDDLVYDILQKIRCAIASGRNVIYINHITGPYNIREKLPVQGVSSTSIRYYNDNNNFSFSLEKGNNIFPEIIIEFKSEEGKIEIDKNKIYKDKEIQIREDTYSGGLHVKPCYSLFIGNESVIRIFGKNEDAEAFKNCLLNGDFKLEALSLIDKDCKNCVEPYTVQELEKLKYPTDQVLEKLKYPTNDSPVSSKTDLETLKYPTNDIPVFNKTELEKIKLASYCVLEEFTPNARIGILTSIQKEFYRLEITEEWENLIIRLLTIANFKDQQTEKEALYNFMTKKENYNFFYHAIDNAKGLDNLERFVLELYKLYRAIYTNTDPNFIANAKNNNEYYNYYDAPLTRLYSPDVLEEGICIKQYNPNTNKWDFYKNKYWGPGEELLVLFNQSSKLYDYFKAGTYIQLPVFFIQYLSMHQNDEGVINIISTIVTLFTTSYDVYQVYKLCKLYNLYKTAKLGKAVKSISDELPNDVKVAYEKLSKAKEANQTKEEIEKLETVLKKTLEKQPKDVQRNVEILSVSEKAGKYFREAEESLKEINSKWDKYKQLRTEYSHVVSKDKKGKEILEKLVEEKKDVKEYFIKLTDDKNKAFKEFRNQLEEFVSKQKEFASKQKLIGLKGTEKLYVIYTLCNDIYNILDLTNKAYDYNMPDEIVQYMDKLNWFFSIVSGVMAPSSFLEGGGWDKIAAIGNDYQLVSKFIQDEEQKTKFIEAAKKILEAAQNIQAEANRAETPIPY